MTLTGGTPSDPAPDMAQALGRIGFVGAGRVGQTLAVAMVRAGLQVAAVASRRQQAAQAMAQRVSQAQGVSQFHGVSQFQGVSQTQRLSSTQGLSPSDDSCPAVTSPQGVVDACDTVFLTVSDDAIDPVCRSLVWRPGQRVVHCSGATELEALASAQAQGARAAGLHPLHTFGDVDTALAGLPGSAAAVEAADAGDQAALWALAHALSLQPFTLPPGLRALYHASAHFAGSFIVALMREATTVWRQWGVEEAQALQALLPLLRSTVRAIEARGLAPGMAGVVSRGDESTLQRHLQAMDLQAPAQAGLYRTLSLLNVPLAQEKGTVSAEQARRLTDLLKAR